MGLNQTFLGLCGLYLLTFFCLPQTGVFSGYSSTLSKAAGQSMNFCFVTPDINLSFVRPCVSMSDNQSGDQINPHLKHMNSDEFPELEFLLAAFWRIHVTVI